MSNIEIYGQRQCNQLEDTWGSLKIGDGISYPDGSIFILKKREVQDNRSSTLSFYCVTNSSLECDESSKFWLLYVDDDQLLPLDTYHAKNQT